MKWLPEAKAVKAFSIITAKYMTNPSLIEGKPDPFIIMYATIRSPDLSGFGKAKCNELSV